MIVVPHGASEGYEWLGTLVDGRIVRKFLSQGNLLAIANEGTLHFLRYRHRDRYTYP